MAGDVERIGSATAVQNVVADTTVQSVGAITADDVINLLRREA